MINPKSTLLILCLCCIVAVTWGQDREAIPVKPAPILPWYGCQLSRRSIPWINGCQPVEPVYQTTCAGRCYSTSQTDPTNNPFAITGRCTCCKATATRRVSVKMQCPVSPPPYKMTATCDNNMKVYFDGVLQSAPTSQSNNWGQATTFAVPVGTQVVGIECEDLHVVGGILASFTNGMVTDDTWQCSSQASAGWTLPSFGGSWPSAHEIGTHGVSPWNTISGISGSAQWIWTEGWHGQDKNVYCRRVIRPQYTTSVHTYTVIDRCGCQVCAEDHPWPVLPVEEETRDERREVV